MRVGTRFGGRHSGGEWREVRPMDTAASSAPDEGADAAEDRPSRKIWKWTALASMASYIDAGSIVAAAAGLPLWESHLGLGAGTVGLLTAFSSNAISVRWVSMFRKTISLN